MNKNSFAKRPPMGWNSYDYYDTNVTEAEVLSNAEFMAKHLRPYGWEYVVVDIQWYAYHTASMRDRFQYIPFGKNEMDEYGRLLPCPDKFPSSAGGAGFKPLADRIHNMGLKFGIHIMRGIPRLAAHHHLPILGADTTADMVADPSSICPWNPDMYGIRNCEAGQKYYDSLLELYASWGVDFIKCDDICATGFGKERQYNERHEVEMLHKAIKRCGRPIVLSLSPGPAQVTESWHYKKYANMWRITDDFWDDWRLLKAMFERAEKWCIHSAPGHWPDADMLPLGALRQCDNPEDWTRFTKAEQRTMMSLWSMMRSPLMIGGELTKNDDFTNSLLTNANLLNIGKESFCGHPLWTTETESVWVAPRRDGQGLYVALFNLSEEKRTVSVAATQYEGGETAIELWTGESACAKCGLSAELDAHDAAVYLVK